MGQQRPQDAAQPVARQLVVALNVIGQHLQRGNVLLQIRRTSIMTRKSEVEVEVEVDVEGGAR